MLLDKLSGQIILDRDLIISHSTTIEELTNHYADDILEMRDMKNGWTHCTIRNIKIDKTYLIITFYFNKSVLDLVTFIISDKAFEVLSWDNYNQKEEMDNRDKYDKWLTSEIGSARNFSWGTIEATFDPKGGSSNIVMRYI